MKKKILPWLFLFVALYLPYAASGADSAFTPIDTEGCQPDASAGNAAPTPIDTEISQPDTSAPDADPMDTESYQPDTYLPLVENYFSFIFELLKMDYLYDLNSINPSRFPAVKKLDWSALLRSDGAFLYGIRLNQSRFALCVGGGWSNLYYSFVGEKRGKDTIIYKKLKRVSENDVSFKDLKNTSGRKVYRSTLKIPFLDFLVRLRFNSVLEAPKEGFHGWLGFKLGLRCDANMEYKYEEYNNSGASSVTNGNFNLNRCACVLQVGVGYHRFGFTGGMHLTPLFQKDKGPDGSDSLRPFSFSIYVDLI
ncbi:hypothetical protein [Cardinium endosymbiont of Encarsia pergandiella]|uniref:hypothetical protein n=1 Tax=Cardinium endosymbiont of Encarsia pergandiella TaxID=249402 RepID=UPI0005A01BF8|nr:hypothetical protein [Cardinium endosymbiont of Encarsia pergandiella]